VNRDFQRRAPCMNLHKAKNRMDEIGWRGTDLGGVASWIERRSGIIPRLVAWDNAAQPANAEGKMKPQERPN